MTRTAHFEKYRMIIEPLSPIHIGSGLTIEPYEYTLVQDQGNFYMLVIDLPRLFAKMDAKNREEYDLVVRKGDFPSLRAWLMKRINPDEHCRFVVQIHPEAYQELKKAGDDPNQLGEVHMFTRDADTGKPYIPGSSLKGAIRTAIVDAAAAIGDESDLLQTAKMRESERSSALFEAKTMGNTTTNRQGRLRANLNSDPLRQIAISDIHLDHIDCYIDRVQIIRPVDVHRNRTSTDPSKIRIYRDVTWSLIDGEEVRAMGELRLYKELCNRRIMGKDAIGLPLPLTTIIEQCNMYYREEIERQLDEFTKRTTENDAEIRAPLLAASDMLKKNQCIIRLGRHSHFECMVVSRPFNIPPRKGYGKTRTYVNGRLPLGWARLTFEPAP